MTPPIEQLFDAHFDSVYRYVFFRVRNVVEAEDITSDIFEKVVRYQNHYTPQEGATIRSWIFSIARNTLTDYFRKKRIDTTPIDDVDISDSSNLGQALDASQQLQQIFSTLDSLTPRQQEIVRLRFEADLSNKEIAELLSINQKTVSATLTQALATLRKLLNTPV